jgi:hypothetical protein
VHEPALRPGLLTRGAAATLVADALAAHPDDRDAAARAYESASKARVEPWYDVSVLTDAAAAAAKSAADTAADRPKADAGDAPRAPRLDLQTLRRIAASGDPELSVLVARTMSLLLTPQEVFGNPEVLDRLAAAAAVERPRDPSRPRRPPITRDDLLAAGRQLSSATPLKLGLVDSGLPKTTSPDSDGAGR